MKKFFAFAAVMAIAGLLQASSIEEIRAKLDKLPESSHESAKAALNSDLGTLLYKHGQMREAAEAFETALRHDTSRAQRRHIYLYMGKSYESFGQIDKAINAYEQTVVLEPKNWRRHRDLALLYEQSDLYRKALASYQTAYNLNPKEASLYLALGRSWRKLTLYREALPWLEKAMNAGFHPEAVQEEYSRVYEGQGQFAAAANASLKSLTADSTPSDIARVAYLAALAGDRDLVKKGLEKLAAAPRDTVLFYENLVELLNSPPADIRADKTSDPNLLMLLRSIAEGTYQ